jgi:Fe-Mn family superoxide dismutase
MSKTISRRDFLRAGTLAALAGTFSRGGFVMADEAEILEPAANPWELPDLPYSYYALEPYIDRRTMEIHHSRHHAAYARNAAAALEPYADLQALPIEELLAAIPELPADIRTSIRNNGGGHWNHNLFWATMSPRGGRAPVGALGEAINATFGDYPRFREQFARAAATVFGSGWAWLIVDTEGDLAITSTPNQDNPLMTGLVEQTGTPILGLDVWEHAYYLLYQNRRTDYITAWWEVIDWPKVDALYLNAVS